MDAKENSKVEETKIETNVEADDSKPMKATSSEPDSATNGDDSEKQSDSKECQKQADSAQSTDTPASSEKKIEEKAAKKEGPKLLDLAFGMDCTGSMGSYIKSAQQGIRSIVEEIVAKEAADVRLALVQYRDHPPQDSTFVTKVNDFTKSVREMKGWLDGCSAVGGGDGPEAVADALHQILKLSWRDEATKICVFISDAPPHGLDPSGDGFPNGCPDGLDPMVIAGQLAEKGVTLYQVGCEPAILCYKEFFVGLAHVTGGQYVPLRHAGMLAKVIVGGAQEEMSLQQLMEQVNAEVQQEVQQAAPGSLSQSAISHRVHAKLSDHGVKSKQMMMNKQAMPKASKSAKEISYCTDMLGAQARWMETRPPVVPLAMRPQADFDVRATRTSKYSKKKSEKKGAAGGDRYDSCSDEYNLLSPPGASLASPPSMPGPSMRSGSPVLDYMVDEEADIGEEQVYRMVQKSLALNKLTSKIRRDSEDSN